MIAKSRFTASSSKPVPEPTVKTEFETVGETADTDAAAATGEARALGDPIEAADTDDAAAEEETCGEACALGSPVEVADTDAAEGEETCAFGKAAAADTSFGQTAAADTEDVARPLDDAVDSPETLRTLCEEDAPMLGLG
jgi:hypothetical protein